MSLRDRANQVMGNFDATKDKATGGFENIPAGDYTMILEGAQDQVYKSGYEAFQVKMSVLEGEYVGRIDSTNLNPDADNDFVANTAIKAIARLANAVGLELTDDDWESLDSLQTAFMESKGKTFIAHITESRNKKDPSNPYRNYDFEPAEQPEAMTISDEDLPASMTTGTAAMPTDDDAPF